MNAAREMRDMMKRIADLERQVNKLPSRISSSAGGGGTGGGGWEPYIVSTREDLPTGVPSGSLGYVETGTYAGGWFSYYGSEWLGLNFWEQA